MKTFWEYVVLLIIIIGSIGWANCLLRFVRSDFQAPYKAEVVYGIGTMSGAGAIIGWIKIKD